MLNAQSLIAYSSDLLDTSEDTDLKQRLGLYQVFLKLYEHHRSLLDEILSLENSAHYALPGVMLPYIQGVMLNQQIYLVTNLLGGKSQALSQPQNIWTIGRDSRQVILPIADKRLSRNHAAIQYVEGQGFLLTDLNSSNGSYVNSERIRSSFPLKDGDRLRLGSLTIFFFVCDISTSLRPIAQDVLNYLQTLPPASACSPEGRPPTATTPSKGSDRPVNPLEETLMFMRNGAADLV